MNETLRLCARRFMITTLALLFLMGCGTTSNQKNVVNIGTTTGKWTTSWATATEDIRDGFWMSKGHFPPMSLDGNTLRMFTRASIGGDVLRVKFSNEFGHQPLTIQAAHIAEAASVNASETKGAIKTNTDTQLTFSGSLQVVLQPGQTLYSDPVAFQLSPLEVIAISMHFGEIGEEPITGHRGARSTSFFVEGNAVNKANLKGAVKKDVWYTATALEVMSSEASGTIVAMGDSITDGFGTKYNYHTRWTDYFAERLSDEKNEARIAMANVGIGGAGAAMSIERFQRDVLDIQGAKWLIIFIGINDIVYGNRSAEYLIDHYKKMAQLARENGLKVYGATITAMGKHSEKPNKESTRQQVNQWIRTTSLELGVYDGIIDFDEITRDPSRPAFLRPRFAVDDLHLNITGYKAMADSMPITLF
jgi:lysophospholipase L1-like esterase